MIGKEIEINRLEKISKAGKPYVLYEIIKHDIDFQTKEPRLRKLIFTREELDRVWREIGYTLAENNY